MIFFEGAGDVVLPCAAAVVVPGLLVVLLTPRRRFLAAVAFAATTGLVLWLRAASVVDVPPHGLALGALFGLGGLLAARPLPGAFPAGAAVVAAAAGWSWQPCVGPRLGEALTQAIHAPAAAVLPLLAYTAGLTLAVTSVGAVTRIPPVGAAVDAPWVRRAGMVLFAAMVVAAAVGWYGEFVSLLVRWSGGGTGAEV